MVNAAFTRPGWIFELKYDGFRVLAGRDASGAFMESRRGSDLLPSYPEIRRCLEELPLLTIDGELVQLDGLGRPQFEPLRRRLALKRPGAVDHAAVKTPAAIFAFDLLELGGKDVRRRPLLARKELLKKALKGSERVKYLDHVAENGERLYQEADQLGLEGIVAKRADSPYLRGSASGWLKMKTSHGRAIDEERAKWNER